MGRCAERLAPVPHVPNTRCAPLPTSSQAHGKQKLVFGWTKVGATHPKGTVERKAKGRNDLPATESIYEAVRRVAEAVWK